MFCYFYVKGAFSPIILCVATRSVKENPPIVFLDFPALLSSGGKGLTGARTLSSHRIVWLVETHPNANPLNRSVLVASKSSYPYDLVAALVRSSAFYKRSPLKSSADES